MAEQSIVRIKTGGRQKGTPNKASTALLAKIEASGMVPLEFMLACMRGEKIKLKGSKGHFYPSFEDMKWGAAAAAPYVHPRLASVQHTGGEGGPIQHEHGLSPELVALIDDICGDSPR